MTVSSTIVEGLLRALSPECAARISTEAPALLAHSVQGAAPCAIATPKSTAEVEELLRAARDARIPVIPFGSGTAQTIGCQPSAGALAISTAAMSNVIQHEPGDMVATVQSGITMAQLQQQLAAKDQFLPLDGNPKATIGGMIATDRHGPRSLGYGTLRDQVLGMTVVNGDGVARKTGGRVVKNVTGYDLGKLYIGSLGTLGIVTEVTFKLRPRPIATRFWGLHASSMKDALERLSAIHARNLPLEALTINFSRDTKPSCGIAVLASGSPAELERIDRELSGDPASTTLIDGAGATPAALDPWHRIHNFEREPMAVVRFFNLPMKINCAWGLISEHAQAAVFSMNGGWAAIEGNAGKLQALIDKLSSNGNNARIEGTRGVHLERPFGPSRPEWTLMKKIRASLDPHGLCNPRRFVV